MNKHIIPIFGKKLLKNIKPADIEKWLLAYVAKGYSSSAVNNTLMIVKIMLSEAERLGYIPRNPAKQIEPIKNTVKDRKLKNTMEHRLIISL